MLFINATNRVIVPTLPKNIVQAISSLPDVLKPGVIPKLNPTVLYAEKLSKARAVNPFSPSVIDKKKIDIPSHRKDKQIIANDFLIDSLEICLLKT